MFCNRIDCESPSVSPGQALDKDEAIVDIMYLSALVKYSPELFTMALGSSNDDFLCDRTSPEWKEIQKIHKLINFDKSGKTNSSQFQTNLAKRLSENPIKPSLDGFYM